MVLISTYRLGLIAMHFTSAWEPVWFLKLISKTRSSPRQVCGSRISNCLQNKDDYMFSTLCDPRIYKTIPSSPDDQNTNGLSGAVAKRLTRMRWQLQDHNGVSVRITSKTNTLQSAAPVANIELPLLGKNFTEKIFPRCGVCISATRLCRNASHSITW